MRIILLGLLTIFVLEVNAQIDYSKLIIGRNNGTHTLHDNNVTNIFGFAETLGESIKLPGPTIEITEGDSVEIDFWNVSQGAPHTIHLHGLDVDQENDGVPHLSFDVGHMAHGLYKFKAPHPGTYIYHCHVVSTIHVQAGMYGVIIVKPSDNSNNTTWIGGESFDRDILLNATEIDTNWHTESVLDHPYDTINPMPVMIPASFDPQYFLINGQSGSQLTDPNNFYLAGQNEDVYMRLVNIGYYGVRYIFPSYMNARTISSDGRPLPQDFINDTIEVLPGERYGTLIETGTQELYEVTVEHFSLSTQSIESSQIVTIKTSALSTTELTPKRLDIYPNPSNTGVFISEETFDSDYTIYTLEGKFIKKDSNQHIDLSNQKPGIYILKNKENLIRLMKTN